MEPGAVHHDTASASGFERPEQGREAVRFVLSGSEAAFTDVRLSLNASRRGSSPSGAQGPATPTR